MAKLRAIERGFGRSNIMNPKRHQLSIAMVIAAAVAVSFFASCAEMESNNTKSLLSAGRLPRTHAANSATKGNLCGASALQSRACDGEGKNVLCFQGRESGHRLRRSRIGVPKVYRPLHSATHCAGLLHGGVNGSLLRRSLVRGLGTAGDVVVSESTAVGVRPSCF